jgi:glycosyltransferase involved in cell wall biosynthesis
MTRLRRIAVNTAIYLQGTSGTATGTRELVLALRDLDAVAVHEAAPASRGGRGSVLNAVADARWDLWQASRSVPDIDLLVSPCNIGFRGRARKHLLVVHDVMAIDRPELFDRKFSAYFRLLVPRSVRSANRVLTLSEHSATAIRRMDPGADVRVVAWPHPGETGPPATFPARPVVLMVGATEPVKNQVAGIEAVARLRTSSGVDVGLRVVGPAGRAEADVRAAMATADPLGSWTSREVDVPPAVLDAAYSSAWVLLQPSHDEGFGLPLVEAARHGLPSVHSGRGAMPSILPEIDVGGISAARLEAAMLQLLDAVRWSVVASAAVERARDFAPAAFRAVVREQVADLLPEPS